MTTQIQQDAIEVQKQIYEQGYYVDLYERVLKKREMGPVGIEKGQYTDAKIVNMANDFWFALPDSPSIRRAPFFQLCNIAEHCFDDEQPDDE